MRGFPQPGALRRALAAILVLVVLWGHGVAAASTTTNYSDQWWAPSEPGWGASVLQQGDVLFVVLFVYGTDGAPTWLSAAASYKATASTAHQVFSGDLYRTSGPSYAGAFNPASVSYAKVGTLSFDAESSTTATLTFSVAGVTYAKKVTRYLWRYENLAGTYHGGWVADRVACVPAAESGFVEAAGTIEIAHGTNNAITLRLRGLTSSDDVTLAGSYAQVGHLGLVSATAKTAGEDITLTFHEIETTASGFTGRFYGTTSSGGTTCQLANGRIGGVRRVLDTSAPRGLVLGGRIEGAIVCNDINRNGRCDASEPQTRSDAAGSFDLAIVTDATAPLVAEIVAGTSRYVDSPAKTLGVSYRLASPSSLYSVDLTPLTTLVQLTGRSNLALAEAIVRDELGLPPRFDLRPTTPPAAGTLGRSVGDSVLAAFEATAGTVDVASPASFATVVAAFPVGLTTLPTLRINTKNAAPIVSRETYIDASFQLTNPAVSATAASLAGQIRGRGHSTWGQPKNPYRIKFTNDAAYAKLADVLGMPKNRHWVLLAEWFDRSLMRNKLALSLATSDMFADGFKWSPSAQYLEVWLNDDYVGVYLLVEAIRIDPVRLAIRSMSTNPAANEVDGGWIAEVDHKIYDYLEEVCYSRPPIDLVHITPHAVPFCIDTPDEESITVPQIASIGSYLDAAEYDIYFRRSLARVNATSMADWYLVNEFFRNPDARFYSSVYMWKDTDAAAVAKDRLLNFGPIWDFDRSAGNVNYDQNWLSEGCWVAKDYYNNWIAGAFDVPGFTDLVRSRWQGRRALLEDLIHASIEIYTRRLRGAQQRNFARWPILGVPLTNYYTFTSWPDEVAFVKTFLDQRLAWLDKAYATTTGFNDLCR